MNVANAETRFVPFHIGGTLQGCFINVWRSVKTGDEIPGYQGRAIYDVWNPYIIFQKLCHCDL